MNKLDEFFKEKLIDHSVTPSAGAWDKVEAGISKKNNGLIWLRWAAVFLIGAFLIGIFIVRNEDATAPVLTEKKQSPESEMNKEVQKSNPDQTQEHDQQTISSNSTSKRKKKSTKQPLPPIQHLDVKEEQREVAQVKEEEKSIESIDLTETEESKSKAVATVDSRKSIVLTYTLPEIEPTPELTHKEMIASDKKDNSLKKVMKFAKDIKNGDAPLTGFRVMKEDLFALDLKKKNTGKKQ
ncbi:MAG: hypothetical protein HOP08_20025 [Cyclobacteriaceae bacterium]|nr:hypothetical protein [Cyclobacteriaceae bacterium]